MGRLAGVRADQRHHRHRRGRQGPRRRALPWAFGGQWPHTPTYLSANKKTPHRLFRFRDDLPDLANLDLRTKIGLDIDIKIGFGDKGSQSLAPPSAGYVWVPEHSPEDCEPALLPDSFIAWLHNIALAGEHRTASGSKGERHWRDIAEGVGQGSRNEAAASFAGRILGTLGDPFDNAAIGVQWQLFKAWNQNNTPPMDEEELARTWESILTKHRQKVTTINANHHFERERPANAPDDWKLEIVDSDPRVFRLYSPLWANATPGGFIELAAEQMLSAFAVRRAALEQAKVWVNATTFDPRWKGGKGVESLARQLVETAVEIEAEPEEIRAAVVAEAILQVIDRARPAAGDDKPDPRGRPTRMENGTVWVQVSAIFEDVAYTALKIKHAEVVRALRSAGAESKQKRVDGKARRFKLIDARALEALRRLSGADERSAEAPTTGGSTNV
ncbi:MAG: primase alpha helix C-terminal domain-containing protein [Planctomycetota bacterium]